MKMSIQSQTILLRWSLVFMIIYGLAFWGLLGMVPPPAPSLTPDQVASFYSEHAFKIKLGAVVTSITSGFMVPWAVVVGFQLARNEDGPPVMSVLSVFGGCLQCLFLVLPCIFWGVAAYTTSRPPEVTALANEIANILLITTGQFYIFSLVPIIYVGLKAKPDPNTAFPRWLCWLAIWVLIIGDTGTVAFMFRTGPFAWNGLFPFWIPFGLYFSWFSILYYCLFSALKKQSRT